MKDTQWPLFEVFQQDREGQPHRNAGSIHAPDGEMALQYARDVFVRRPQCSSLWVVPAGAICRYTAEEIDNETDSSPEESESTNLSETYYIFQKKSQRRSLTYVAFSGDVVAHSKNDALTKAIIKFGNGQTFVWWICPEKSVIRSELKDAESMFLPASTKQYRMPQSYRVLREMMAVKSGKIGLSEIEDS